MRNPAAGGGGAVLPRRELLEGARHGAEIADLIDRGDRVLRTWTAEWSDFLEPPVREEAESRLGALSELVLLGEGGYAGAERQRLLLQRADSARPQAEAAMPCAGLEISGNFLFDPAGPGDFRTALLQAGAAAGEVGDLWLRGDRGAQAIVTEELAGRLDGRSATVRSVEVLLEARPLDRLQLPGERQPRPCTTVEASLRLDAVASAGFGVSRQRMADRIREGAVRIDWEPVTSPSREVAAGDRIRLDGRGELLIESLSRTQRGRWRIVMERR